MNSNNFGMFFHDGNESSLKQKDANGKNAPWIAQLKSVFAEVDEVVKPYATKNNSFNDIGDEVNKYARIYFVVNGGKYRIFGLAKGVGEVGRAAFNADSLKKLSTKQGEIFDIDYQNSPQEIDAFCKLVEANGEASPEVINRFIDLCNELLVKLGIGQRISKLS